MYSNLVMYIQYVICVRLLWHASNAGIWWYVIRQAVTAYYVYNMLDVFSSDVHLQ